LLIGTSKRTVAFVLDQIFKFYMARFRVVVGTNF